jgi:hypothetical protein
MFNKHNIYYSLVLIDHNAKDITMSIVSINHSIGAHGGRWYADDDDRQSHERLMIWFMPLDDLRRCIAMATAAASSARTITIEAARKAKPVVAKNAYEYHPHVFSSPSPTAEKLSSPPSSSSPLVPSSSLLSQYGPPSNCITLFDPYGQRILFAGMSRPLYILLMLLANAIVCPFAYCHCVVNSQ